MLCPAASCTPFARNCKRWLLLFMPMSRVVVCAPVEVGAKFTTTEHAAAGSNVVPHDTPLTIEKSDPPLSVGDIVIAAFVVLRTVIGILATWVDNATLPKVKTGSLEPVPQAIRPASVEHAASSTRLRENRAERVGEERGRTFSKSCLEGSGWPTGGASKLANLYILFSRTPGNFL